MKNAYLLIILFMVVSCTEKLRNQNDFGKYLLDNLVNQKTEKIKAKFLTLRDSSRVLSISLSFFNLKGGKKDYNAYLMKQDDQIKKWYNDAAYRNFSKENITFLRTKLDSSRILEYSMKVYFLHDKKEHYFILKDIVQLKDGWAFQEIESPVSKEEIEKLPYTPYRLFFPSWNWEWKYINVKKFSNFFITLSNNTGNDFDYIRYRVTIFSNSGNFRNQVFRKTYERNGKVYNDNTIRFEVFELRGFFIGVDVTKQDNFSCEIELLDAKPIPYSVY